MQDLTRGANCPVPSATVTVSIACASAVDVSALLLAADGKVRSDDDFVFYNNPTGPGVSYLEAASAPHGVDAVRVDTTALPPGVEKVVVTASLDGTGPETFASAGSMVVTVLDADATDAVHFDITELGSETALVCVEVYLRNGAWKIRAVGQGYDSGLAGIATDFGITVENDPDPAGTPTPPPPPATAETPPAPPSPPPAAPPAPAPAPFVLTPPEGARPLVAPAVDAPWISTPGPVDTQPPLPPLIPPASRVGAGQTQPTPGDTPRVNLDKGHVSLVKNQSVSLVKTGAAALSKVAMGVGWDPAKRGRNIDLDASVIAFDAHGKELECIWFMHKQDFGGAIRHSGDNLSGDGDGDDEVINVDLQRLPTKVHALVFTVTSFGGQDFTAISSAYCRLLDVTGGRKGSELVRFELTNTQPTTGAVMCKLVREADSTWSMTSIGTFHQGRSVKKLMEPARAAL